MTLPLTETEAADTAADVTKLPPVMLPLVLTEAADTAADVIKLPPVTLPVTETVAPVCVVALTLAPPRMLPPVMLPVAEILVLPTMLPLTCTPPLTDNPLSTPTAVTLVWLAVVSVPTMLAPLKLPPVMLPVADIKPGVVKLAPAMAPVTFSADTTLLLKLSPAAFRLPPVMLPLADTAAAFWVTKAPKVVKVALYVVPLYTTGATVVASTVFVAGKAVIATVAMIFLLLFGDQKFTSFGG